MRIIKSAVISGDDERFIFTCFDNVLKKIFCELKYSAIKIEIADKTASFVKENSAFVLVDKNSFYVKSRDEKFTSIVMAKNVLSLPLSNELPEPLKDLIVFRKIIKAGFSDALSYYFYVLLSSREYKGIAGFVEANIPWLCYVNNDQYYSELFYAATKNMGFPSHCWKKCSSLFGIMRKDVLFSDNLERAERIYKRVVS